MSIGAAAARALAAAGVTVVVSDVEMGGDSAQGAVDPLGRAVPRGI